jgi:hypothetical protein
MTVAMNPVSAEFFHKYRLGQASLNISMSLWLREPLDAERLAASLRALVELHPILRSVAEIDLTSKERYRWRTVASAPPLVWREAACSADDRESAVREAQDRQHNLPLDLTASPPFVLYATNWNGEFGHLQLVAAHAALDGRSLALFFADLLRIYWGGESLATTPHPPHDWEALLESPWSEVERQAIQGPVLQDLSDGSTAWPALRRSIAERGAALERPEIHNPYPRPLTEVWNTLQDAFRAPTSVLRGHWTAEQLAPLRQRFAEMSPKPSLYDAVLAAYVKSQAKLAAAAGERFGSLAVGLAADLRPHFDERWRRSLGNFFAPAVFLAEDRGAPAELVWSIAAAKRSTLERLTTHWLKQTTGRAQMSAPIPAEAWDGYQAAVLNTSQPTVARVVRTSNLGVLDTVLPERAGDLVERIETASASVGLPMPSLMLLGWRGGLSVSYTYVPAVLQPGQAESAWREFAGCLTELIVSAG